MTKIKIQEILENNKSQFKQHITPYLQNGTVMPLQLKLEHTLHVLEHALDLTNMYPCTDEIMLSTALAALYHDIGRFEQFAKWQTFSDAHSCNHALLGVREMRKHHLLEGVPRHVRHLALAAVSMHNRYALPKKLSHELRFVVNIVRDADKLDILRVMAEHLQADTPSDAVVLHVRNEPDVWTNEVIESLCRGEIIEYKALRTVNDFRILLVSWIHSFSFPEARKRYIDSDHIKVILEGLPKVKKFAPVWAYIQEIMYDQHTKF